VLAQTERSQSGLHAIWSRSATDLPFRRFKEIAALFGVTPTVTLPPLPEPDPLDRRVGRLVNEGTEG
jgi:hypothetical protein